MIHNSLQKSFDALGLSYEAVNKKNPRIIYTAIGIIAALMEREKTGKGRLVTVSLLESAISMTLVESTRYLNTGTVAKRNGNRHHSIAPYNSFETLGWTCNDQTIWTLPNHSPHSIMGETTGTL